MFSKIFQDSVQPDGRVDSSRLEYGTNLLPQTCDMFIKTLDEVMRLSDANFVYTLSTARVGDPAAESAILHHHHQGNGNSRKVRINIRVSCCIFVTHLCIQRIVLCRQKMLRFCSLFL